MTVSNVISEYKRRYNVSFRQAADEMNEVISSTLGNEGLPVHRVHFSTLHYWATGKLRPNPIVLDYIRRNANGRRVGQLAADILTAITPTSDDSTGGAA